MVSLKSADFLIKNIDTIILDKDGTIIDLHFFWGKMTEMRAKEIVKRFNLNIDFVEIICKFLGYDLKQQKMLSDGITALYSRSKIIEILTSNMEDLSILITQDVLTEIFDYVSQEFYLEMIKYTKPISEAVEFLKYAKDNNLKLAIVTADSIISTEQTLRAFGWENLFDVVIARESCNETKESGVPTRKALKLLKSSPEKTLMIGDAPTDYISAINAGIQNVILVSTGQLDKKSLMNTTPFVIESLAEIEIL